MLRDYVNKYIEDFKKRGNAPRSISSSKSCLNKFVGFVEQNSLDFRNLTTKQAKLLRNIMVEQGLKPGSINNVLSSVKGLYDFLIEEGVINRNPILSGRLRVKQGKTLPGFMTDKELQILNNWLDSVPHEVALGFRTML